MNRSDWNNRWERLKKKAVSCKFALLVIGLGLLLILWPQGEGEPLADEPEQPEALPQFSVDELEEKMEQALSCIAGAGEVTVVLTVETEAENIYASDRFMDDDERRETLVIVSGQDYGENAVLKTQCAPTFRGALIICEGGGDPQVRLLVSQAVAALTGLGTDRIIVCKGN